MLTVAMEITACNFAEWDVVNSGLWSNNTNGGAGFVEKKESDAFVNAKKQIAACNPFRDFGRNLASFSREDPVYSDSDG